MLIESGSCRTFIIKVSYLRWTLGVAARSESDEAISKRDCRAQLCFARNDKTCVLLRSERVVSGRLVGGDFWVSRYLKLPETASSALKN